MQNKIFSRKFKKKKFLLILKAINWNPVRLAYFTVVLKRNLGCFTVLASFYIISNFIVILLP